jgi:hypothetical protein
MFAAAKRRGKGSNEFFTVVNGRKTDAPLHDDILDNPEAEKVFRRAVDRLKKELGITASRKPPDQPGY